MAYVDSNGKVLTGEALERAKRSKDAPVCKNSVKLGAKFCNKCGSPAPKSWWQCGACHEWIRSASDHCPHCGHEINHDARFDFDNGVWQKDEACFAQRFELDDVAVTFKRGLKIQEGTCGVLLCDGALVDILPPGNVPREKLVDLSRKLENTTRRSIIIVDEGELVFSVISKDMKSKEDIELEVGCMVTVAFNPDYASEFIKNVFGSNGEQISKDEVSFLLGDGNNSRALLGSELRNASKDLANGSTIEELFKDAAKRIELEDSLSEQASRTLESLGFKLVRVSEVDFRGGPYEELRRKNGQMEADRREKEYLLRSQQIQNDYQKRHAMSDQDMKNYMDQLAHEKQVKDYVRRQEMAKLNETWKLDRGLADLDIKYRLAKKEITDQGELHRLNQEFSHEREKLQAEHQENLKNIAFEADLWRRGQEVDFQHRNREWEQAHGQKDAMFKHNMDEAKLDNAARREAEAKQLAANILKELADAAPENVMMWISNAPNVAMAREIRLAWRDVLNSRMTPEQLLAYAATHGHDEAARALAKMKDDNVDIVERLKNEAIQVYKDASAQFERMFNKSLDSLSPSSVVYPPTSPTSIINK